MTEEGSSAGTYRERHLEYILEYENELCESLEQIDAAFANTVGSDYVFNNFDKFFEHIYVSLHGNVDPDDIGDVAGALANLVVDADSSLFDELSERSQSDDILHLFRHLKLSYGIELDRSSNQLYKGHDWWSNIKSDSAFRSNRPVFHHELIRDYDDRVTFTSDVTTTLVLANHFLRQLVEAPDELGDDVLSYLDRNELDETKELIEEFVRMVDEYDEEMYADRGPEDEFASGQETDSDQLN